MYARGRSDVGFFLGQGSTDGAFREALLCCYRHRSPNSPDSWTLSVHNQIPHSFDPSELCTSGLESVFFSDVTLAAFQEGFPFPACSALSDLAP